jgi:hypothetical protein
MDHDHSSWIDDHTAAVLPPPAAAALVANAFSPENCLH